ncbi:MAG: ABC transporter ATP-binding protein [Syntrophomonadaceae bacterium]|jgi:ABC-2 type transport system ATP-binding protein|nr:ABC transporter ATP-binding protein [Syntrophomonadaceae bacterium]
MSGTVIEITNLKKNYGAFRGIVDVNFTVEEGEIYGFIGPNGAGKSTTIRTLLALIHPTSGKAAIWGKDCIAQAAEIAKDVGYLPSESSYYENMKVREFLSYAAALYGKKVDGRIKELAERLNLDTSRKISDLSFGNKKKVGIVAALLHSPKLIILDEPTSGLDPLVQQTFFDILREENQKGATILFSSHVLSEVQKICGRVAIIKEGQIINIQKISDLRKNGYKKIALTTEQSIPQEYFDMPGIASYNEDGAGASFLFMGKVGDILGKLHNLPVSDVFIEEPTLEEIFLHYYK